MAKIWYRLLSQCLRAFSQHTKFFSAVNFAKLLGLENLKIPNMANSASAFCRVSLRNRPFSPSFLNCSSEKELKMKKNSSFHQQIGGPFFNILETK